MSSVSMGAGILQRSEEAMHAADSDAEIAYEKAKAANAGKTSAALLAIAAELRAARLQARFMAEYERRA